MTCQDYQQLWEQEGALEPGVPQQRFFAHATTCPTCRALLHAEQELRQQLQPPPITEPSSERLARLYVRLDPGAESSGKAASMSEVLTSAHRGGHLHAQSRQRGGQLWASSPRRSARALGAAALLVTSLLVGRTFWLETPIRFKGDVLTPAPSLDMQASVERTLPTGQVQLLRTETGMTLDGQAGLIFRFTVQGGAQLVLVERSPSHRLTLLLEKSGLDPQGPSSIVEPTSSEGHPLRYLPDGESGDYTLLALLLPTPVAVTPDWQEQLWQRHVQEVMAQNSEGAGRSAGVEPSAVISSPVAAGAGVLETFRFTYVGPASAAGPGGRP